MKKMFLATFRRGQIPNQNTSADDAEYAAPGLKKAALEAQEKEE